MLKVTASHEDSLEATTQRLDRPFPTNADETNHLEVELERALGWTEAELADGPIWTCKTEADLHIMSHTKGKVATAILSGPRGDVAIILIEEIDE